MKRSGMTENNVRPPSLRSAPFRLLLNDKCGAPIYNSRLPIRLVHCASGVLHYLSIILASDNGTKFTKESEILIDSFVPLGDVKRTLFKARRISALLVFNFGMKTKPEWNEKE